MDEIVGRKKEIEYLQQIVKSEDSEFVAVNTYWEKCAKLSNYGRLI